MATQRRVDSFVEHVTAGETVGQSSNAIENLRRNCRPRAAVDRDHRCSLAGELASADRCRQAAGYEGRCAICRAGQVIGEDRYAGLMIDLNTNEKR